MRKLMRAIKVLAGLTAVAVVVGFFAFAGAVMQASDALRPGTKADGIVVLTGGHTRIAEAARLLTNGHAQRLLISGVNRSASRKDLIRISKLPADKFNCCVDVGYEALDTIGNADETRSWATARGYKTLIVVTSSYHMPRSIAELSRELPDAVLIAHPVQSPGFTDGAWVFKPRTARVLVSEYLKFLPAAARLAVSRVFGQWQESAIAEMPSGSNPPANI